MKPFVVEESATLLQQKAYEQGKSSTLKWLLHEHGTCQEIWDIAISWNPWTEQNPDCAKSFLDGVRLVVNAGRIVSPKEPK